MKSHASAEGQRHAKLCWLLRFLEINSAAKCQLQYVLHVVFIYASSLERGGDGASDHSLHKADAEAGCSIAEALHASL